MMHLPSHPIAETEHNTVLAEYAAVPENRKSAQSEAELEEALIEMLSTVGYERVRVRNESDLVSNLRVQLERLNKTTFSPDEWTQVFHNHIANPQLTQAERTRLIQSDPRFTITRDDGSQINVSLIDKRNLMANYLQVTNQYSTSDKKQRYDVTVLVNGLPLVHMELKRRGVSLRRAFQQIERYQESFHAGTKLFGYVQLFVISNGTDTKYYSNTTRAMAVEANTGAPRSTSKLLANKSFAFASYWADTKNNVINDLLSFAETFMVKRTLLNILTRYCIFDAWDNLLVMRPYQIAATEKILNRILGSARSSQLGTTNAGGYIWHTTGSGKTLTSFKTAQLATQIEGIDKVIFAVDRQDLDYQTVKEYERFQEGAVSANTKTKVLAQQLEDDTSKIIVTTIQKLNTYVASQRQGARYPGHVVLIFDECHRSQFGSMHERVARYFSKRHSFGFTGTPIFEEVARRDISGRVFTTDAVFGERLHTYTIVDAIRDGNVLKFNIRSHSTMSENVQKNTKVRSIDVERALLSDQRVSLITEHILDNYDRYTKRSKSFIHSLSYRDLKTGETTQDSKRISGFNAIFATASISAARAYYREFSRQQEDAVHPLKVAMIYSQPEHQELSAQIAGAIGEDTQQIDGLSSEDHQALADAVADYNTMFGTSFTATSNGFGNYYKDLSQRIRNREVDLVIVVNIFLTGFDAPALNTLFVDKNLRHHGLIQAFSRTNRILNPIKDSGVVITYRDLSDQIDAALTMFGDGEKNSRVAVVRPYHELLKEYREFYEQLTEIAAPGEPVYGEAKQRQFVTVFSAMLRLLSVLNSFEDFEADNPLSDYDLSNYISRYLDIRDQRAFDEQGHDEGPENVDITDDLEFEIELVRHMSVGIDYISELLRRARDDDGDEGKSKRKRAVDATNSSPSLRPKRDLILEFLALLDGQGYDGTLIDYLRERALSEITAMIESHRLSIPDAYGFIAKAFALGSVDTAGTALANLLPPMSLFSADNARDNAKLSVAEALETLIERFGDVVEPQMISNAGYHE